VRTKRKGRDKECRMSHKTIVHKRNVPDRDGNLKEIRPEKKIRAKILGRDPNQTEIRKSRGLNNYRKGQTTHMEGRVDKKREEGRGICWNKEKQVYQRLETS